ncbi:hypothetical protein BJ166DRAFT_503039 [Pestalotiopsis sp. NC0098]|nr:hypothetical protein BJ166DRAFT_503039 [Pestalotiopsis sp. NC0098]
MGAGWVLLLLLLLRACAVRAMLQGQGRHVNVPRAGWFDLTKRSAELDKLLLLPATYIQYITEVLDRQGELSEMERDDGSYLLQAGVRYGVGAALGRLRYLTSPT